MAKANLYRPEYSLHKFTASNRHFINELFYQLIPNHIVPVVIVFAAGGLVFACAFLRRDRLLQLLAFWVVITPLPIDFISLRGDACLHIPLFGWAMILANVVSDSVTLISKPFVTVDQGGTEVPRRPAQILRGWVAEHG
jgi:hypothetical protein